MLFFESNPEIEGKSDADKNIQKGRTALEQARLSLQAINENIALNLKSAYENLTKNLLAFEDSTMALNRTMGGFADTSGELQRNLEGAYLENLKIGASFKDAAETAQGMASEMGRMINPSQEVLSNAIAFSKAASMSNAETGKMIVQFQEYGGNQKEAIESMSKLGISARKSGLDAKSFTTEVAKNLKQASLFGFKNGVKDIEEMVKKTKLLGTSLEKLGIGASAKGLLDPEKAMETAANLQMIGGNIGALGDPFQLLYMGQKDMKKLTDEVLNMSKATFTFDKTTGAFSQTTEDMYALRAQAEALGINYEEAANAGKELAKVDFIKSSTKLAEKITDEDTQNLVAGLAQISKDGSINIDLPGLDKKFDSLDQALADPEFITALEDYQKNATKSDKDLALAQMSVAEKQLATENEIKNLLLFNMNPQQRKQFLAEQESMRKKSDDAMLEIAQKPADKVANSMSRFNQMSEIGVTKTIDAFGKVMNETDLDKKIDDTLKLMEKGEENVLDFIKKNTDNIFDNDGGGDGGGGNVQIGGTEKVPETGDGGEIQLGGETKKTPDGFFPSGDKPTLMSRGKIYEGLAEDSVYMGTDFEKIFSRAQNATNLLSEVMSQKNNAGGNTEVSGKIDFGTLTVKVDAPSGVDKSVLEQALNGRQFTTHIMNMVANQKSFYSNQSTLEG